MTTCNICKLTLKESREEGSCGCPLIFQRIDGQIIISWRGYPMKIEEYMRLQQS